MEKKKKSVTFAKSPDKIYYILEDEREARNGSFWVMDRIRFQKRIANIGKILEPCLLKNIDKNT